MGKAKRGIPNKLKILEGAQVPGREDEDIPMGDWLEETVADDEKRAKQERKAQQRPEKELGPEPQKTIGERADKRKTARDKGPNGVTRGKMNVSLEAVDRLDALVRLMSEYGPEKHVRKSEVLEAAILVAYEARQQLDLSNVRRRGRYGSATHKTFPLALTESIKKAIVETDRLGGGG